jgi:NADP-dependent 3-hydroxy acid dehydrogenase YdfG
MTVAVVTGSARGLGFLIAERLAKRGYSVLLTDVLADEVARSAKKLGGDCWSMAQDVRDPASHKKVAAAAAEKGPIRLWVNNAGVLRSGTAWGHPVDDVRLQVDVNVLGVMYGSTAAIEAMSKTGGGHIINIASISAICPVPGLAVYAATKHAVLGYTLSLQGDLDGASLPIKVTAICPDAIETDLVRNVQHDEHSALLFSNGSLLRAEDVADQVVGTIDDYKLQLFIPKSRAALAQMLAPFPALGLKILKTFSKRGESFRRKRKGAAATA